MLQSLRLITRGLQQKASLRGGLPHILALQRQRLRSLVVHAKARSPFYAERYRHVDANHFRLEELPILTKTEMMTNFDRFLTDRWISRAELEAFVSDPVGLGQWFLGRYAVSRTSGTQGLQALIVQDGKMMELLFALQMVRGSVFPSTPVSILQRLFQRARLAVITIGRGFYPSAAALAYAPPSSRHFINRLWLSHIEPLPEVVERLNDFRPHIVLAYANVLEILAREELGGRLRLASGSDPLPRGGEGRVRGGVLRQVINMSEPLSEGAAHLIQQAFGLRACNNYATGECMALSTGCPKGHGMHLQADWAILEVVERDNHPVPPGQPGEKVLITNLYNHVQPFIRYEVADVVTMSPTPCPCGNPLPLIAHVEGRTDEMVWIEADGRYRQLHPYIFVDVLDEYPAVGWYQIVQTERNRFLLRASPAPGRQVCREELERVMREGLLHFGLADVIRVDIEIAPDVAPNPKSGKLKRITSRIGPPAEVSANGKHESPIGHPAAATG